jgi:hypothetical protein
MAKSLLAMDDWDPGARGLVTRIIARHEQGAPRARSRRSGLGRAADELESTARGAAMLAVWAPECFATVAIPLAREASS